MINQETIQRIMDATRIEEVIGDFVSLKKRGANHIGCCPFHNEKTPSFYVSPSKGIFKCFGCGKAGNAVGFLMDHEHYTYPEALRWLAQKYNIEIEEERMTDEQRERQSERDALFHVSEFAQKYFSQLMWEDEMGRAVGLGYFHERGLTDKVIKDFGLGYCLDKWTDFTDHARKNGYSDEVLEKTGLTIFKNEEGKTKVYDRFRGRVMFPIYSISGRVLGFSGRILSKEKQAAKYVNSPDSDIYNKSHILYGLFQAKNAISRADRCYLVEGNVDVVSMHQSDVCNTVASCGTSLTVEQIRLIKRYTQNVTVVYDGDSAGIKAALRAFNLLFEEGMHAHAVLFPDEEDPDSYAQKYGSTRLQEYLRDHEMNFVEFKMATSGITDISAIDPIRKSNLIKEYTESLALIQDPNEQSGYVTLIASALRVGENDLRRTLAQAIANRKRQAWKEEQRELAREQSQNATETAGGEPLPDLPDDPQYPVAETATGAGRPASRRGTGTPDCLDAGEIRNQDRQHEDGGRGRTGIHAGDAHGRCGDKRAVGRQPGVRQPDLQRDFRPLRPRRQRRPPPARCQLLCRTPRHGAAEHGPRDDDEHLRPQSSVGREEDHRRAQPRRQSGNGTGRDHPRLQEKEDRTTHGRQAARAARVQRPRRTDDTPGRIQPTQTAAAAGGAVAAPGGELKEL